jgi:hypothetical protein
MEDSRTPEGFELENIIAAVNLLQATVARIAVAVERLAVQGEASYEINCHNVEQLRQLKGGIISATLVPPGNRNH